MIYSVEVNSRTHLQEKKDNKCLYKQNKAIELSYNPNSNWYSNLIIVFNHKKRMPFFVQLWKEVKINNAKPKEPSL